MVMGTNFVFTVSYSWLSFFASLIPFFLVSDLLLLNQLPDIKADKEIGRRHFPIMLGVKASVWIYGFFLLCTYAVIGIGFLVRIFPVEALFGLSSIVIAIPVFRIALKNGEVVEKLLPAMKGNVMINILTPVLLAVGLFWGQ